MLEALTIQRVQHRMARAVSGGTGALHRRALAKFGGMAAKRTLVNLAFFGARKRHPVMLQLIDRLGRLTRQIFHCVGITEPVGALDRIIHMPLPAIGAHIAERCGNTALCCYRMGTCGKHLGHTSRAQPLLGHAQRGAQPGTPGADNHHIIVVGFVFVSRHLISQFPKVIPKRCT